MNKKLFTFLLIICSLIASQLILCNSFASAANNHILTTKGAWTILQSIGYGLKDKEIKFNGNTTLPDGSPGQDYVVTGDTVRIIFTCTSSGYPVLITAVTTNPSIDITELGYSIICSIEGRESDTPNIISMIKSNIQMYAAYNNVGPLLFDNGNTYMAKGYTLNNGCYGIAIFKD